MVGFGFVGLLVCDANNRFHFECVSCVLVLLLMLDLFCCSVGQDQDGEQDLLVALSSATPVMLTGVSLDRKRMHLQGVECDDDHDDDGDDEEPADELYPPPLSSRLAYLWVLDTTCFNSYFGYRALCQSVRAPSCALSSDSAPSGMLRQVLNEVASSGDARLTAAQRKTLSDLAVDQHPLALRAISA